MSIHNDNNLKEKNPKHTDMHGMNENKAERNVLLGKKEPRKLDMSKHQKKKERKK